MKVHDISAMATHRCTGQQDQLILKGPCLLLWKVLLLVSTSFKSWPRQDLSWKTYFCERTKFMRAKTLKRLWQKKKKKKTAIAMKLFTAHGSTDIQKPDSAVQWIHHQLCQTVQHFNLKLKWIVNLFLPHSINHNDCESKETNTTWTYLVSERFYLTQPTLIGKKMFHVPYFFHMWVRVFSNYFHQN